MADKLSSSPPKFALGGLKTFLPFFDEATLSTRGQTLPALLQGRVRRPSSIRDFPHSNDADLENGPLQLAGGGKTQGERDERRMSTGAQVLVTPQMRSQRLIGSSNPRYKWEQYFKPKSELKKMPKPIRKYYERNNYLIQQYIYIDRLLDSSLPHNLLQEYHLPASAISVPSTIHEESEFASAAHSLDGATLDSPESPAANGFSPKMKVKRTPKNLYKLPAEDTPLLPDRSKDDDGESPYALPDLDFEENADSGAEVVTIAIYINLVANTVLLILKVIVTVLTASLSVIASLVDGALDFLSTAIVWTTTRMISHKDQYTYPVGRRRLEPIGVLVFSVIMITSFFQVALEGINRLSSGDHTVVQLTLPAVAIMASTVVVKLFCWLWCRLIKNSSVQALAQDAVTDVVFNTFSIIFPLVGYFANIWWLDPVGGISLSIYVIVNWSLTSMTHIRNLTGAAASADERNVLLYLTMRFAKTIKHIQGLQAYHAGDKLIAEVDIVLDENMSLRDSHDLGESLQYMLESVPFVDRAFVHQDYATYNLPSHMQQHE